MFDLDFESEDLQFPSHPRHEAAAQRIKEELRSKGLTDHFLLFSSGTTSSALKGYALSRRALFANARAVNEHFNLNTGDVWGLSLPYFHVGGLSVLIRAYLLGTKALDLGVWEPKTWARKVQEVSVTTVVPTQIYDLVQQKIKAPQNLRALIVGGDYLSSELEARGLDLGWPVIRTFGMTEVCSQLASARRPGGPLELLPIHTAKIKEGRLLVKSEALFTLQFNVLSELEILPATQFCDDEGFLLTSDMAALHGNTLTHLGRLDDQIKVSGKLVSINALKDILARYALQNGLYGQVELILETDERIGKRPVVLHLPDIKIPDDLFAPLKVEQRSVPSFERTDLGKLRRT